MRFLANTATASSSARCRSRMRASTAAETISLVRHANPTVVASHGVAAAVERHVDAERLGDHRLVDVVVTAVEGDREHLLLLAAHHGEHAVRRHALQRFGELEVVAKLLCRRTFRDLLRRGRRPQRTVRPELPADGADELGVLGRALDEDVPRTVERRGGVGDVVAEELPRQRPRGRSAGSASSRSASGSSPASRAICALVRRLGL